MSMQCTHILSCDVGTRELTRDTHQYTYKTADTRGRITAAIQTRRQDSTLFFLYCYSLTTCFYNEPCTS